MNARVALFLGAVAMLVAVAFGAFGAHALRGRVTPEAMAAWQTAVQYQAWHALALLAVGLWRLHAPAERRLALAGALFAAGIVLFSGSLYALALTGVGRLGVITPFGGVALLGGWGVMAWCALVSRTAPRGP